MKKITMYSTRICPYCLAAKRLLKELGLTYEEIKVDTQPEKKQEMIKKSGRFTVPQIFIEQTHVGGYTDLVEFNKTGKLKEILESS